jgi:hypothetical protein
MKKSSVHKLYSKTKQESSTAQEPLLNFYTPNYLYKPTVTKNNKPAELKDFTFTDFKKVADKIPLSLAEWAKILHTSERTLQRYAIDNSCFNGLQIERILHMKKLVTLGNKLLGNGFKSFLQSKPFALQHQSVKSQLTTYEGIQRVIDLLGRIEHGIVA